MSLAQSIGSGDSVDFGNLTETSQTTSDPQPTQTFVEKLYIGLDYTPHSFNLREKVLGAASANLQYINKETGVQISLRGIGSLSVEPSTNTELQEPLHLLLEHQRFENLNSAIQLSKNLIETLHQEFQQFQQTLGPQGLLTNHIPSTHLGVPSPNVISNASASSASVPLLQHHQLSLIQQQFVPQNGLQMQIAQNGMIIQQTPNYSMQLPLTAQSSLLPMKSANQIQIQLQHPHAPPSAPFILNTQPQAIQYQYIQQTTTRDLQGNQHVIFQPILQHSHIPVQSQQQFITVQQGNAAYMVPQPTIIQQAPLAAQPATQLSIIHQHIPSPHPSAPQMHVQLPAPNIQQVGTQLQSQQLRHESKSDALDALPTSSSSQGLSDIPAADSNSHENSVADLQLKNGVEQLNKDIESQPQRNIAPTRIPRPPLNMPVPPTVQHFIGGNVLGAGTATMTNSVLPQPQSVFPAASIGRASFMASSNNSWQQTRALQSSLGQPLMEVQQLQSMAQQPPIAVTFTQPTLQQSTQQFVHMHQPQQQQQHQQYNIIQTAPLNNGNALQQQQMLQFHQIQPTTLQVQQQQQQFHHSQLEQQAQLLCQLQQQQQQQQQLSEQAQMSLDVTSTTTTNVRSGQKRRPPNDPESSSVGGPSPNQKIRAGAGSLNNTTDIDVTSMPTHYAHLPGLIETGGVGAPTKFSLNFNTAGSQQFASHLHQHQPQPQQVLKPTHVGVMRYNQSPNRPAVDPTCLPSSHSRNTNCGNTTSADVNFKACPLQQQLSSQPSMQHQLRPNLTSKTYGQRMQAMHTQSLLNPPPPTASAYTPAPAPRKITRP